MPTQAQITAERIAQLNAQAATQAAKLAPTPAPATVGPTPAQIRATNAAQLRTQAIAQFNNPAATAGTPPTNMIGQNQVLQSARTALNPPQQPGFFSRAGQAIKNIIPRGTPTPTAAPVAATPPPTVPPTAPSPVASAARFGAGTVGKVLGGAYLLARPNESIASGEREQADYNSLENIKPVGTYANPAERGRALADGSFFGQQLTPTSETMPAAGPERDRWINQKIERARVAGMPPSGEVTPSSGIGPARLESMPPAAPSVAGAATAAPPVDDTLGYNDGTLKLGAMGTMSSETNDGQFRLAQMNDNYRSMGFKTGAELGEYLNKVNVVSGEGLREEAARLRTPVAREPQVPQQATTWNDALRNYGDPRSGSGAAKAVAKAMDMIQNGEKKSIREAGAALLQGYQEMAARETGGTAPAPKIARPEQTQVPFDPYKEREAMQGDAQLSLEQQKFFAEQGQRQMEQIAALTENSVAGAEIRGALFTKNIPPEAAAAAIAFTEAQLLRTDKKILGDPEKRANAVDMYMNQWMKDNAPAR